MPTGTHIGYSDFSDFSNMTVSLEFYEDFKSAEIF